MNLEDMKGAVILIALVALIGAAAAIALSDFQDQVNDNQYDCANGSFEYNITCQGLTGINNTTNYLGTIGTIIGVSVLIGIVVLAFTFVRR